MYVCGCVRESASVCFYASGREVVCQRERFQEKQRGGRVGDRNRESSLVAGRLSGGRRPDMLPGPGESC